MKLKELMEKTGLTQQRVAYDLQLTPQAMSHYITGRREPDYETLVRIADYFHVSTDFLLGRDAPYASEHPNIICVEVGDKRIPLDGDPVKLHVNGAVINISVVETEK